MPHSSGPGPAPTSPGSVHGGISPTGPSWRTVSDAFPRGGYPALPSGRAVYLYDAGVCAADQGDVGRAVARWHSVVDMWESGRCIANPNEVGGRVAYTQALYCLGKATSSQPLDG